MKIYLYTQLDIIQSDDDIQQNVQQMASNLMDKYWTSN